MTISPGFRAVVFALRDLPAPDQQYIADVTRALCGAADAANDPLAQGARLWSTPLLLTRLADAPPIPGLRGDAELRAQGLSALLIALRLLTVDALHWPELRFLGLDLRQDAPDFVLYVADPARWTVDSLAQALQPERPHPSVTDSAKAADGRCGIGAVHVQRGLRERPRRYPPSPGDRVPILGWQVPLLGGNLKNLIDCCEPTERPQREGRFVLPLGVHPGHQQGRYALFVRMKSVYGAAAQAELVRIDRKADTQWTGTLELQLGEQGLQRLAESSGTSDEPPSDDEAVAMWLGLLLVRCLLCAPSGEILLLDLFGLELSATLRSQGPEPAPPLRTCRQPVVRERSEASAAPWAAKAGDQAALLLDPQLLDPELWPLDVLAEAIDLQSAWVSPSGRLVRLHLYGTHDGEPLSGVVLIDTCAPAGTELLASLMDDEEMSFAVDLLEHDPSAAPSAQAGALLAVHTTQHTVRCYPLPFAEPPSNVPPSSVPPSGL